MRDLLIDSDQAIDDLYPESIADLSGRHWTPVAVARRAAALLAPTPRHRVLDLGAGPGKFCIVGALSTGASFTGIEQRHHFVVAALELTARLQIPNVHFIHANILDVDWRPYDSYYLFNPFAEQIMGGIDDTMPVAPALYGFYIAEVRRRLCDARSGTRVVTYHGFGGAMPSSFRLTRRERCGNDELELWIKDGDEHWRS
jgi:SAM-dependent methyltransferase